MMNWEKVKLGDLCEVITKGTTPTSIGFRFTDSGVKFIKVESLTESGEIIPNKVAYIDEDCHRALKRSQLKKDDILFSIAGALGRIGIVNDDILPANTNQALAIIRLKKDSNALVEFIAKYFISNIVTDEIEKLRIGAAQQNLSLSQLNNLSVPLPPLPEQQRIVSILDEAFAAIAKAKANAEQNLKNAKVLFESYLQGVFEKKGEGWEEKTLGDICDLISGQHIDSKEYNSDEKGIGYLTGPSDFGDLFPTVTKWTEYPKRNALRGDILITVKGSGIGKINLMFEEELCISRQLMAIRPNKVETTLLYAFIQTKQKHFQSLSNGAAIPGISRGDVLKLKIHLPSLIVQKTIVRQLDTLRAETQKLEALYQNKITNLEELKKSILQKAFSGGVDRKGG